MARCSLALVTKPVAAPVPGVLPRLRERPWWQARTHAQPVGFRDAVRRHPRTRHGSGRWPTPVPRRQTTAVHPLGPLPIGRTPAQVSSPGLRDTPRAWASVRMLGPRRSGPPRSGARRPRRVLRPDRPAAGCLYWPRSLRLGRPGAEHLRDAAADAITTLGRWRPVRDALPLRRGRSPDYPCPRADPCERYSQSGPHPLRAKPSSLLREFDRRVVAADDKPPRVLEVAAVTGDR